MQIFKVYVGSITIVNTHKIYFITIRAFLYFSQLNVETFLTFVFTVACVYLESKKVMNSLGKLY